MKISAFFFILFPLSLFGQINIINTSLTDSNKALLYVGIDNFIVISGIDIDSSYTLSGTATSIQKSVRILKASWEPKAFRINAYKIGSDTLRLYQNDNLVIEKVFQIDRLTNLTLQYGNLRDSIASVEEILANTTLKIVFPDCYWDHHYQIINFDVSFYIKYFNDAILIGETYGDELTTEHIGIIKQLEPGEKIIFPRTIATCPSCSNRWLGPLTITVR